MLVSGSSLYVLTAAVWILCIALLAQITWWLIEPTETATDVSVSELNASRVSSTTSANINIERIAALGLFGTSAASNNRNAEQRVPKTSLNLRLVGVSASTNPSRSAAIIEQGAQQQTYVAGDAIAGSSVILEAIYADRVVLDNNGRLETLQLEDIGEDRPALSLVVDETSVGSTANEQLPAMQQLAEDPQALTDYVAISPALQQGKLIGYRLQPGKKPRLFNQAGFQPGDLAVAINGYDLTDTEQAMQLTKELNTLTEVNVQVVRQGQPVQLSLQLPQSQDN
ncbi:MAG: type II secretion system protein GspC [Pseudomonadota bacterium]